MTLMRDNNGTGLTCHMSTYTLGGVQRMISFTVYPKSHHQTQEEASRLFREAINRELDLAEAEGCVMKLTIDNEFGAGCFIDDSGVARCVKTKLITIILEGEM
jgi:hypothetical protein